MAYSAVRKPYIELGSHDNETYFHQEKWPSGKLGGDRLWGFPNGVDKPTMKVT